MFKLPKNICILDIETAKTSFKYPEKCILAIAGIKIYKLKSGKYYSGKYQYFTTDNIKELEPILKDFPGIIIGHNIFGFDYRVLMNHIDLRSVIEKTIDVQMILYKKCGDLKGLSLAGLCHFNLGKGKTIEGNQVSFLWGQGKYKKVIEYNHNDCKLTKSLWWHIVRKRKLKVVKVTINRHEPKEEPSYNRMRININKRELEEILGQRCKISYKEWIQKNGKYIEIKKSKIVGYLEPQDIMPEHIDKCPKCKSKSLYKLDVNEMNECYRNKMTEGQEADYYAGLRGVVYCRKCGYTFDYQM